MTTQHTYESIAQNWALWTSYVDDGAVMTREEFDSLSIEEKIQLQIDAFGTESNIEED